MRKSTMVELVEELRKLPQSFERDEMIEEALKGEYHDFKNEKYTCGKVAAVGKLLALGANSLASDVMNGVYDEEPDETDLENMRKTAPKELWKSLGLEPKA